MSTQILEPSEPTAAATPVPAAAPRQKRQRKRRLGNRPIFRVMQLSHRWLALILGLLLLVITVTGSVLVFKSEIQHVAHPTLFHKSDGKPVGFQRAIDAVHATDPAFTATYVQIAEGRYYLSDDDSKTFVLDAATGHVNGTYNPQKGIFGFIDNLHECGLGCENYTGYIAALNKPIGGIFGKELTWSGLLLGVLGLLLGILVISGMVVWWPGIRSIARGFKIRRGASKYKFNYDLHKVVGIVALPFLAVWALTGAGFELPFVANAWYAALPGSAPAEPEPAKSAPRHSATPISLDDVVTVAAKAVPNGHTVGFTPADPSDKTSVWDVWVSSDNDPYDHGMYPGDKEVAVDQFSGKTTLLYGAPGSTDTVAEDLWEHWNYPIHAGTPVNGWWRTGWLIFGMTPVLLAITGVTTWWIRRGKAKAKKQRRKAAAAVA
ncbi:MAG: PepSY-associated TM helix domain-containing protein [Patulibacter sp.]